METQPPGPGQDPPTDQQPTGGWQQPPAQPAAPQPAAPQPAAPQWQQPAQPPAWQQPPAQPAAWQQAPAQPTWGQPAAVSGWGDPAAQMTGHRSTAVTLAGIVLMLFSVVPAILGGLALFAANNVVGTLVDQFGSQGYVVAAQTLRDVIVVIGIIFGGFGVLGLLGGLGMVLRSNFGRVLAFLVAGLGTLIGLFAVIGSLGASRVEGAGSGIVLAVVIFAGYAFAFIETLIGGRHFRKG